MLITLSGLDGAGKSTLTEALRDNLEKEGHPAVIFHMNKEVGLYAYVRRGRDAIGRLFGRTPPPVETGPAGARTTSGPKPQPGRAKAMLLEARRRIIWNKGLRRWVDVGDLATFIAYRMYIEKTRGHVLIMDRYFYDRMADVADGRRWRYLRWFAGLVPVPDLAVFVEVSPEEAFSRKGEYSVESMTRRRAIYREIFSWVPGSVILNNDELDRALSELQRLVRKRMGRTKQEHLAVER